MSDLRPSEPELAPVDIVGAIRLRAFGLGIALPLAHLVVDVDDILIRDPGRIRRFHRSEVARLRLRRRIWSTRVDISVHTGYQRDFSFVTSAGAALRRALDERGWTYEG